MQKKTLLAVCCGAWLACGHSLAAEPQVGNSSPAARQETANAPAGKPLFDKTGAMPGEQLPDLTLRTLANEPKQLSDVWHAGPALLLASSFTCPKSRSKWPEAKALAEKYGDKLNVVIVYVIEAHPSGDICPYKGVEDVTPENRRDGILRHQPTTLDARLELAKEFKQTLGVSAPIYVDAMDNTAWKSLGGGPNMGVLVRPDGIVAARQGWFDGPAMEKSIDELLAALAKEKAAADAKKAASREFEKKFDDSEKSQPTLSGLEWLSGTESADDVEKLLPHFPELATITIPYNARGNSGGCTLLVLAAREGNVKLADLLLAHGADINSQTENVPSALHEAAFAGKLAMVGLLLHHHADPNLRSPLGRVTPLLQALINDHRDIAINLIKAGAAEDFFSNIGLGKIDAVRRALKADPNRAIRPDGWNRVPLDYAAATDQFEIGKLLLENGAPAGETEDSGRELPLHWAVRKQHPRMVELLLKAGSSPNSSLYREGTPLHMAAELGNAEIAKLLTAYKADTAARNDFSQTPLHLAAAAGHVEVVEALIHAKADVNAVTGEYNLPCGPPGGYPASLDTPLHLAAARGNAATIKVLLAGGAKLDARNANGETPLLAAARANAENMEVLIAAGADIKAVDKRGHNAYDWAARWGDKGDKSVLDALSKHGLKPNKPVDPNDNSEYE